MGDASGMQVVFVLTDLEGISASSGMVLSCANHGGLSSSRLRPRTSNRLDVNRIADSHVLLLLSAVNVYVFMVASLTIGYLGTASPHGND